MEYIELEFIHKVKIHPENILFYLNHTLTSINDLRLNVGNITEQGPDTITPETAFEILKSNGIVTHNNTKSNNLDLFVCILTGKIK